MEIVSIRQSSEVAYPDALVVLEKNSRNSYSVYRYSSVSSVDSVGSSENLVVDLVFSSTSYTVINALFLIDEEYALAVVEGSEITIIYYKEHAGMEVPSNYGISVMSEVTIVG